MKPLTVFLSVILLLIMIAVICYATYYSIYYLWVIYSPLDEIIRISLFSLIVTIIISAFIVARTIKASSMTIYRSNLLQLKLAVYKSLLEIVEPLVFNHQLQLSHIVSKFNSLEPDILLLASGAVLDSYAKLYAVLHNQVGSEQISRISLKLIKAIRRDLGHAPTYGETRINVLIPPQTARES